MKKQEFISKLRQGLKGIPQKDIEERLCFYSEMIDDRMEDGLLEEEAIAQLGSVDEIVKQTISSVPLLNIVKEKIKPKRKIKVWEIVLLVLGFPVWGALLIALVAVVFSLFVSLWAVIISLWVAVFLSGIACGIYGVISSVGFILSGNAISGIALLGGAVFCVGLAMLFYSLIKPITKGSLFITKKLIILIKRCVF